MKAKIAFEDGRVFEGISFGAAGERAGEAVFNTSLTGYQEILTDPSYKGQIVAMTYPLIGNYGINPEDPESKRPFLEGFIVRERSRLSSNWRSRQALDEYLRDNNIMGIEGVDTRAVTRHIRLQGAMKAVISTDDLDDGSLVKKAGASHGLAGRDLVKEVTCREKYNWKEGMPGLRPAAPAAGFKIVVLDCGVKYNILRMLVHLGCIVTVVPAAMTAREILNMEPDGILLSNGPGDPAGVPYIVETVRKLLGRASIFGICLGHQLLALALGGRTYKLKFGHHGGNHPVKDLKRGRISITVQNHGFCVDIDSLNKDEIDIAHVNLNDNTLEGMRHKDIPAFSVQFHPESSPGPHDARYIFGEFIDLIKKSKVKSQS